MWQPRGHIGTELQRRKLAHCPLRETKPEDSKESGIAHPGESLNKRITIRSVALTKLRSIGKMIKPNAGSDLKK